MSLTNDELLARVVAEPDNLEPRRVYADWLMERGDARGEYLQLACDLAEAPPQPWRGASAADRWLDGPRLRAEDLRARLGDALVAGLWSPTRELGLRAGFVEHLGGQASDLMPQLDALAAAAPLRSLRVRYLFDSELRPSAALGRLARLRLDELGINLEANADDIPLPAELVAALPARLERLTLMPAWPAQLHALAGLTRVEALTLSLRTRSAAASWRAAAESPYWAELRALDVGGFAPRQWDAATLTLLATRLPRALDTLNLGNLGAAPLAALADAATLPALRHLGLRAARNATAGLRAVIERCESLRSLDLSGCELGGEGLRQLLPLLSRVERLKLQGNDLDDDAVAALAAAELPALVELDLDSNAVAAVGCAALTAAEFFPRLRALGLSNNPTGDGAIFLAAARHVELRQLALGGNTHAAATLLRAPTYASLRSLSLGFAPTAEVFAALAASGIALCELDVETEQGDYVPGDASALAAFLRSEAAHALRRLDVVRLDGAEPDELVDAICARAPQLHAVRLVSAESPPDDSDRLRAALGYRLSRISSYSPP